MALFVDSALLAEIAGIAECYPITGITTNPSILLAAWQGGQHLSDLELLRELLSLCAGPVFMQPDAEDAQGIRAAAERYIGVAPDRVVPKLSPTEAGLQAGMALVRAGARVAFTATCSLAQAYCAIQAGATWIIPYFARIRRSGGDPEALVSQMARLLVAQQSPSRILAASIKSPADLAHATLAGAHDVTVAPDVIRTLLSDPTTSAALDQFRVDARTLRDAQC
jgi:TalC/MipB family fructose-6-phosphate aldolase